MRVQLTNAGAALLDSNEGPIQVSTYELGSDYGYIPEPTDTGIHGTQIYSGSPSQYFVVNANVVKYSVILDYSLGPFNFGEIGLFTSTGVLFALATGDTLLSKIPTTSSGGNAVRLDIYLSLVNENYQMWLDYADTNSDFRMAVLQSVDQLPPSAQAAPNAYIITGATASNTVGQQSAYLAYTDTTGLWNFDAYAFASQKQATITACDAMSVTIANADYTSGIATAYYGDVICQFSSGVNFSICRYVQSVVEGSSHTVISFYNSVLQLPAVGDTINFFSRQSLSTTIPNLPIATTSILGGIVVGNTLSITPEGTLNVNPAEFPVTSVNNMTGDVEIIASDVPGLSKVALTGQYTDILGAPGPYILPVATRTVLGGVKSASDGNITIAGDGTVDIGFAPVKSVNGLIPDGSGNVAMNIPSYVVGLISPVQIGSGGNLNSYTSTGIYFCTDANAGSIQNSPENTAGWALDVESFSVIGAPGDCVQRLTTTGAIYFRRYQASTSQWTAWVATSTAATLPIATTVHTGMVSVGAGLNVTGPGVLSTVIQTINGVASTNVSITPANINAASLGPDDKVPFYQATTGDWFTAGQWDASANHIIQSYTGRTTEDPLTSLNQTGMVTLDTSYNGNVPNTVGYKSVYQEGAVYEVITAGSTSIDGISTWKVGDFAVSVNGKWSRVASSLPIATTTQTGVSSIGAGLGITVAGQLSTIIQTINGAASTNVSITPASIGAASLVSGKVPFYQSPSGDWFTAGQWDASTNHLIQAYTGKTSEDTSTALQASGMAIIDTSYNGNNPNSTGYKSVYQEGAIYEVTVAGSTNLDGINTWNVGDFAVSVNGKWARIALTTLTPAPLLISGANTTVWSGTLAENATQTISLSTVASANVDVIGFVSANLLVNATFTGNTLYTKIDLVNTSTSVSGYNEGNYVGSTTLWAALGGGKTGNSFSVTGTVTALAAQGIAADVFIGYFMYATG